MNITEVRNVVRQAIAEAMEKGTMPEKSGGKLVHFKKELAGLKKMKESLGEYTINEGGDGAFVAEYAHMQKFVNELEKIKALHANLAEMLDNQISQVEGKVSSETQKVKEMMGLIEKAPKKPAAKKDDKKAPAKKDDKKEEPKEKKADLKEGQTISIKKDFNLDGKDFKKGQTITTQPDFNTIEAAGKAGKIKQGEHFVMGVGGHMEEAYFKKKVKK